MTPSTNLLNRLERMVADAQSVAATLQNWDQIVATARQTFDALKTAQADLQRANDLMQTLFSLVVDATIPVPPPADPVSPPADPVSPPADPPAPPPPPPPPPPTEWQIGPLGTEPWPRTFHHWGEMHDAKYCGDMLLSCGFRKDSPVIVQAIRGISPCGQTSRIIWPNDGKTTLAIALSRMPSAKADGLSIVSVDTEGAATSFDSMRAIALEARRLNLRVIQAPKATLDHLPGSDAQDSAILNATAAGALFWIYGSHWDTQNGNYPSWVDLIRTWHNAGLTIQAIPMCDSGRRAGDEPYNTQADIIAILRGCAAAGLSCGLFNPALPDSKEELQEAAKLYA